MSDYEQVDEASAAEPGARDSGVAHKTRSAHSLEASGYQEPPPDEGSEGSTHRRKPGEEKKESAT